jgi:nucleoside-diphosphate-sugar epimerase
VSIVDVVKLLVRIAFEGKERLYNVASGINVTNREIAAVLHRHTGCRIEVAAAAPTRILAPVSVARIRNEFDFVPRLLSDDLPGLIEGSRRTAG